MKLFAYVHKLPLLGNDDKFFAMHVVQSLFLMTKPPFLHTPIPIDPKPLTEVPLTISPELEYGKVKPFYEEDINENENDFIFAEDE